MVPEKQYSRDSKMKINELLRTNERFNLNQAQVARNCCCVHTPTRTSLKDFFSALPFPYSTGPPRLRYLLTLFPGLPCHWALPMGTCRFPKFSLAVDNMGKDSGHPLWFPPIPNTHTYTLKASLPHVTPFCCGYLRI